ncbi:TonB-dependent receptor [Yeosuana sp. MJ-SS3]|uniref:TonB-dependent receptor n=1 Tax=Gilvirhabdus luticola TaxID=3079858 RepID=A0ABU3U659_9FLAO|nr:TonB-dependent receptor [Yeosuana sp. MJ-SS3]MDU8885846.1 TonB-dependent receptor [Yeosuana sp. MJ-SS3]
MQYKLSIILLLFVASSSFAQIKLEGVVKDSIGNPLELSNVVAINQSTENLDSYGITNDQGEYRLNLKKNTSYTIQVSYIGMKTFEEIVETSEDDMIKNFNLMPDNTLDAVELIYEMPVTIKGDTLVYNVDSFKDETDKKLEDVLKKLPGVDINDDGEIEVEGKVVDKVMVEGKDFFDGDTKLATKNIPADALDKVQVLKNYDEVSQLQNVRSNEDNIAINIKLKEGKKNFWFGEITAGLGPDERYLAHPKLFYYSPKYSINIITDMNNIGEVPFTMRDYFKFSGGFRGLNQRSGTGFNVEAQDMGFLTMQNNKAKAIDTKFGAANFSYSPKKTWDLSGFAIYSGTRTELEQNSIKRYVQSETGDIPPPDETTQSKTHQKVDLGLFKLSSSYKPNGNNHLDYDIFAKVSKQNEYQDFYSSILQNVNEIQKQSPFSLSQNLNYYYTLNNKNIFALEVQHLWQDENPFYNATLEQSEQFQFTDMLGLDTNQTLLSTAQDKSVKTNKLDAKIDYWYVLNQKSNINFTLGTLLSKQQFDSKIFQILDNGDQYELDNSQVDILNDVKFNFSDVYLGLHYRLKSGIFTFSPGFSVHSYTTKNNQFGSQVKDNFIRLLPDFDTRIQLKKSETLNFRYSMENSFTDVDQLAEAAVFNNYNVLYQGNRNLENSLSHNLNLSYFSFNMFNYTNVFAYVNYSKGVDEIRSRTEFLTIPNPTPGEPDIQTTSQVSTSFNSNFADESVFVDARFEKSIGKFKASIGGNLSYSKYNQMVNNQRSINESFSQSYKTRLSTNFRKAPNFEVGYNLTVNEYEQGSGKTKFYTQSPFANMDAYFLKGFIFRADYSYFNYKNDHKTLNNYSFFDAGLSYQKKDSKWEYKVRATNILNTKSLNQDNSNTLYTSVSEYFIQPRYIIFSIKYDL